MSAPLGRSGRHSGGQSDVLGYVCQCVVYGQRAVTRVAHRDWVCPACSVVAGFGDVDVLAAEPVDEWPLGKVVG